MAEIDTKHLGRFATNMDDSPFLSSQLFQVMGNLTLLSPYVTRARKLRRLDTTRHTKSADLYCRIIWYCKVGLQILEQNILPLMQKFGELKALAYKLRASYYHLYVLFHNKPAISLKARAQVHTPPGFKSPRNRRDKGKGMDRGSPNDPFRPSSVQPTHEIESGGPVGGVQPPTEYAPDFLIPAEDYRPVALECFQEACAVADKHLWGSHPLRLSAKVEMCAFLYDCLHEKERSRQLAKATIAEVYNAQEGMDDDMFEDAAELVGILGRMMKRGLGSNSGSTPGNSEASKATPSVAMPGMMNPI
ncbi:14-3-3 domain-containing protein [Calycina marina]|uniref:14-3-3 domain-containing protein n=1 Tax=Calycina marina TaxID=1763456 RepID=A0A9P8CF06_9HELO|nr:14-3-3 domain-containing protein [Calycina marina]